MRKKGRRERRADWMEGQEGRCEGMGKRGGRRGGRRGKGKVQGKKRLGGKVGGKVGGEGEVGVIHVTYPSFAKLCSTTDCPSNAILSTRTSEAEVNATNCSQMASF